MKSFYILPCLFAVCASVATTKEEFKALDGIRQEAPCSTTGGMCTFAEDCPDNMLTEKPGLCPEQLRSGIECCYTFSVKETRCFKHGGECILKDLFCNAKSIYKEASDCEIGTKCCIQT